MQNTTSMTLLFLVRSSAASSSSITDFHSLGRRPDQRTRTPHSSICSTLRWMISREKPMRKRTSWGERFQFSVENVYRLRYRTPASMAPAIVSNTTGSAA